MPDDPDLDAVDPDQALMDRINSGAFDATKPLQIGFRIDFAPQLARQAAADLLLAGHPSVRLELQAAPAVIVTVNMIPTLDSLRSMRAGLNEFAAGRDAEVVGVLVGGEKHAEAGAWRKDTSGFARTPQADERVMALMFAWDVDLKQVMTFRGGIGFPAESSAREAAAALMTEGYPEVSVAETDFGPVVEAVIYMTPDVKAIRKLRLSLTEFAEARGASWLGFHVAARAPA